MMHRNQFFAVMRQVQDAKSSKVVNIEGVADRVVEVDTCSRIENYLNFFYEYIAHFWGQAQTFYDEVTVYGNYSFFDYLY
jgi:hypothetical protein